MKDMSRRGFVSAVAGAGALVAVPEYTMQQVLKRVKKDCVVVIDTLESMNGKL